MGVKVATGSPSSSAGKSNGAPFMSIPIEHLHHHMDDPLVASNASYLLVALVHYSYGRVLPCIMYVAVAYVGANYHTRTFL